MTKNRQVITTGDDPLIRVTDWSGNELDRVAGSAPGKAAVATSPSGTRIACATLEGVHCLNRGQARSTARLTGCNGVVAVAMTEDERQVVAGDFSGGIWTWYPKSPAEPTRLAGKHASAVRSLAITPDDRFLISGAEDGSLLVWDLRTGRLRPPGARVQAGLDSDQASEKDRLGFTDDVNGLAELVLDRESSPPLAIALLGRWGSGKSSFLAQLHNRVGELVEQGENDPRRSVFATAVHQVRFDAWHYNDDHVWVGIVEHLLATLAEPEQADNSEIIANRDTFQKKLQALKELSVAGISGRRRRKARVRLWWSNIMLRRALIAWSCLGALLLAGAGVIAYLWTNGLVWTWLLGAAAVLTPIITTITSTLPVVRQAIGKKPANLENHVRDTRMKLARIDTAQELAQVIEEARNSGYEQYRGLFGRVHADLRNLSDVAGQAFEQWDKADKQDREAAAGTPPLERVILYIDDLDRCSPQKVVDVLAAVHMLLALPLFVVVVAVDPRWLRRCLEQYHADLFGGRDEALDGATPLDYLDKIFQVVFGLRPMGSEAERYISALVPTETVPTPPPAKPVPKPGGSGAQETPPDKVDRGETPQPPSDSQPDRLRLRPTELEFIQRLRPLLATPRAVKRFINLYRLVRTTADEKDFVDTRTFHAVLVLLAVLVATPQGCRELITKLRDTDREGNFVVLVEELAAEQSAPDHEIWTRLLGVLTSVPAVNGSLSAYRLWAGTIARFSFETWNLTEPRKSPGEV